MRLGLAHSPAVHPSPVGIVRVTRGFPAACQCPPMMPIGSGTFTRTCHQGKPWSSWSSALTPQSPTATSRASLRGLSLWRAYGKENPRTPQ